MKNFSILFLALLLAACGGDSSENSNSDTTGNTPAANTNNEGSSANSTEPAATPAPIYEDLSEHATDIPGLIRAQADYMAGGQAMRGYVAYPEGSTGRLPAVIVIHEWWGHNQYARSRADQLAELGYVAMAVDMYGDGKQAAHPDDAGSFAMAVMGDAEVAKSRFEAALFTLKNYPFVDPEQIAAIGYCFGGSVALTMANAGYDLDAVAAFHSGVNLPIWPEGENSVKAQVLVCNGADDPFISAEDEANFKSEMEAARVDFEYINYPGAQHAFTDPGADAKGAQFELPLAYNAEADEASWEKLKDLLASVFTTN
ncbi:MAG: dienelactone hydrolase family protein [Bacteroidota bacterium]